MSPYNWRHGTGDKTVNSANKGRSTEMNGLNKSMPGLIKG